MHSKKTTIILACVGLASLLVLSACGSGQPTSGSTVDLAAAAQQTVVVILTGTAQAKQTEIAVLPTATLTPEPPTAAPTAPPSTGETPATNETPGSLRMEPTRNVVYETPSGNVVQEPIHNATVEPTK